MKKYITIFILGVLMAGCGKEDASWFKSNKRYKIPHIYRMDASMTNAEEDLRETVFSFVTDMTIIKKGWGSGSGEISMTITNYEDVFWYYDPTTNCYYYDYQYGDEVYHFVLKKTSTAVCNFMWYRKGIKQDNIDFSDYDNALGLGALWELLGGYYTVEMDYTLRNKPATAGQISLVGDNHFIFVLKH